MEEEKKYIISEEDLLKIVEEEMSRIYDVEGAIKAKEEEDKQRKEIFEACWYNFNVTNDMRKTEIQLLYKARLSLMFSNILSSILAHEEAKTELDKVDGKLKSTIHDLREERKLMEKIKVAMQKLQSLYIIDCHFDIDELISMIYDKNQLMFKMAVESINLAQTKIKGYNIIEGTNNSDKLDSLNQKIDSRVLRLGLK